jgi:hypothetical protein
MDVVKIIKHIIIVTKIYIIQFPVNRFSYVIPAKAGIQSENSDLDPRDYPRMTNGKGST